MTVCIAALAAQSRAIMCIADRALTFAGDKASAQTDSGVTKIIDIPGTNWCAMFSGEDLLFPERVLERMARELAKLKRDQLDRTIMESAVKTAFYEQWPSGVTQKRPMRVT